MVEPPRFVLPSFALGALGLPRPAAPPGSCGLALCASCRLAFLGRGAFGQLARLLLFAAPPFLILLALLGFPLFSAERLRFLAASPSSASLLRGLALCAFCRLAFLGRGAFGQLARLFFFTEALLFVLLPLLGLPLFSAERLRFLAASPSSASLLRGLALCAFCRLAFLGRGAFGQLARLFFFTEALLFLLLPLLGLPVFLAARLRFLAASPSSASLLRGLALCAFCRLAFLGRGAFGQLARLFFFTEALLFLLLPLLGLPVFLAACFPLGGAHRRNSDGWVGFDLVGTTVSARPRRTERL